jgi:peptide/nickel transport system permease protein
MTRYLARRLFQALPLLVGITLVSFVLMKLAPGGPLSIYAEGGGSARADVAQIRAQLGLDDPVPVQYARWVGNLLRGDWGNSFVTYEPVVSRIAERLPSTLYLMAIAFVLMLLIAIPLGVLSAVRQYSWIDYIVSAFAFAGQSAPPFWFGLLAILLFSVQLGWLPTSGASSLGAGFDLGDRLLHLVMPAGVLAFVFAGGYTRYIRAAMLEVLHRDYIRTARAKGLREEAVVVGHAFKNAAQPVVTLLAIDLPELFTGAVVVETIFAWPGMGRLYLESVVRLDYPVLMAILTISAGLIIVSNLLADVVYAYLDPRVRYR